MFNLASIHANGEGGVAQDLQLARNLLARSLELGCHQAEAAIKKLGSMTEGAENVAQIEP